jgi:TIR domain
MSKLKSFPDGSWSTVGALQSGFRKVAGTYGTSYAIDQSISPFLNGRVAASIRLVRSPLVAGGVVARADDLFSFAALYVVTDDKNPERYKLRLSIFKHGNVEYLRSSQSSFAIADHEFDLSLQFFSGGFSGQLVTKDDSQELVCIAPERPFPGYCGVIRFYGSRIIARNLKIEEISMRPKLLDSKDQVGRKYKFNVFLTHATPDKQLVVDVAKQLKAAGVSYWIDHEQINFGDSIVSKIEDGLENSRYVVACLSKNFRKSGWSRGEYGPILYREFGGETERRVIPLSLDGSKDISDIPILLSDRLRADFTDKPQFAKFLEFLSKPASGS